MILPCRQRHGVLALAAISSLFAIVSCGDNLVPPGEPDSAVTAASAAVRVAPGGQLAVSVTLENTGALTWPAGMRIAYQGDAAWTDAGWALPQSVPPGGTVTLSDMLSAPTQIGLHALRWQAIRPDGGPADTFGEEIVLGTEVTCNDGLFCNGDERYVRGECRPGASPCDDGAACSMDACDEERKVCAYELGADCASCAREVCEPSCEGVECGDDGCGGQCGDGCGDQFCVDGQCSDVSQPGTCANPLPLLAEGASLIGTHVIEGDTSAGLHTLAPACNTASGAKELVYTFTLDSPVGVNARVSGYDTVLDIRRGDCRDTAASVACSDDATPPGNTGSRIATTLEPGTYYVIVDGYSVAEAGPFTLSVRFTDGCVPQCDGSFCGDDSCGGSCGECDDGEVCTPQRRCLADPCIPACEGRACGSDGCGGTCGTCTNGDLCIESSGECRAFPTCNHLQPVCGDGCGDNQFCGTDCECHDLGAPMPDLIVEPERLASQVIFETRTFDAASCAVFENCVGGMGERRLLRFTVVSANQGRGLFKPPPPEERPDLFEFSACHAHYHFKGFATYSLFDLDGNEIVPGRKQAYCLIDSEQTTPGPNVACDPVYDCTNQGLQAGWADIYSNDIECQWLDITDIAPGMYRLEVTVNPDRVFEEISFDNNTASVPVIIE